MITGLALSFSACRVKNEQSTQLYGYDTLSGQYATALQSVKATVKLKGDPEKVASIPFTYAYKEVVQVMSDPILFYFEDPIKGTASIRNVSSTDRGFSVNANAQSMAVFYSSAANVVVSGCRLTEDVTRQGGLNASPGTRNGYQTRGFLRLDYGMEYSWTAATATTDCTEALTNFFSACYQDASVCAEADYALIHSILDPFVLTGLLTVPEIEKLERVRLVMEYR